MNPKQTEAEETEAELLAELTLSSACIRGGLFSSC
jgi:hypothetical protein